MQRDESLATHWYLTIAGEFMNLKTQKAFPSYISYRQKFNVVWKRLTLKFSLSKPEPSDTSRTSLKQWPVGSQRYLRGRIYFAWSSTQCFLWMAFLCYPSSGSFEMKYRLRHVSKARLLFGRSRMDPALDNSRLTKRRLVWKVVALLAYRHWNISP